MQNLLELPACMSSNCSLFALEMPLTERIKVLEFLLAVADDKQLPLYFWNQGYSQLQQVIFERCIRFVPTDIQLSCSLAWLLNSDQPGLFVFEGVIDADDLGHMSPLKVAQLANLAYELPKRQQLLVATSVYVELPSSLQPLIPAFLVPLPDVEQVSSSVKLWIADYHYAKGEFDALVRSSLGIPLGELEAALKKCSRYAGSVAQMIAGIIDYKKSKLKGRGVEFISSPDVPEAAGLDLLDAMLERAAALLKPEAARHNLKFPKGIILWGPPGTGKSLSAKLAASKMGVPLICADWAGLRGATAYESRKNLRDFLQLCDRVGERGLVLYFDDFDKGFAGFDSDADGGLSRQLAGKLLTWMQERTSQVLVMATVNRLEFLPPELIRRFDDIVFVDLPHAGARYEIFKLHMAKYFPDLELSENDWWRLIRESRLLTPAEIANMVRKTAEVAFYKNVQRFPSELDSRPLSVTVKDFLEQRYAFTPSMVREEDKIIEIRNKAAYARPASGPDKSKWYKEPEPLFGG